MHGYWLIGTIANKYDLASRNLLFFTIFILDSTMDKNAVAASTKNVMANVKYKSFYVHLINNTKTLSKLQDLLFDISANASYY